MSRTVLALLSAAIATACASATMIRAQSPSRFAFEDRTKAAGLSSFHHAASADSHGSASGSGVAVWDFDNDGLLDLYLLNGDARSAALFHNRGDGTFEDVTDKAGVANGRSARGVCVGDVDNDGFEDVYVTNAGKNRLYRYARGRRFEDIAERAGVAIDTGSVSCAFKDLDRDGWLDLLVYGASGQGAAYRNMKDGRFEKTDRRPDVDGITTPMLADLDNDGQADNIGEAIRAMSAGAIAVGDFDNDGALDVAINTINGPPVLAHNVTKMRGHWVALRLLGDVRRGSPRDAIGARVIVTTSGDHRRIERRVIQAEPRLHFGLGDATAIDTVEVEWRDGYSIVYDNIGIDRLIEIDEATGPRPPVI